LAHFNIYNIRDYASDKHRVVDDYPFGGGAGMLMKPEPIFRAMEDILGDKKQEKNSVPVILTTPQGQLFSQPLAFQLANHQHIVIICGHYEGIDDRVREHLVTHEISIGDYVLSGGELPALVIADTLLRLVNGVLGSDESAEDDSHSNCLLEHPQYTRPADFCGLKVPEVLLSGNHAKIAAWRREQSIKKTMQKRPDLLAKTSLTKAEKEWVEALMLEQSNNFPDREQSHETDISAASRTLQCDSMFP